MLILSCTCFKDASIKAVHETQVITNIWPDRDQTLLVKKFAFLRHISTINGVYRIKPALQVVQDYNYRKDPWQVCYLFNANVCIYFYK